jgi:hypothetical protein
LRKGGGVSRVSSNSRRPSASLLQLQYLYLLLHILKSTFPSSPLTKFITNTMKDLRILCFGASLVEGFTQGGFRYTPYSISMSRKLREKWPQMKLDVDVNGMSGDMVTGGYKARMERACEFGFD